MPTIGRLDLRCGWVDLELGVVHRGDEPTSLSRNEHRLLTHLASLDGRRASREELLVDVWGYRPGVVSRTVFSTVERLRRKIEVDPTSPDHLLTDALGGYRLETVHERPPSRVLGREALIREIERHPGPLALTGPPGIGKTAVAAAVAERARVQVLWIEMLSGNGDIDDERDEATVRLALGLGADADLRRALASRAPLLLVLDGLVSGTGAVTELVTGIPDVRVLATIAADPGAWSILAVPPLEPDDAVALLERTAQELGIALPAGTAPDGSSWASSLVASVDHHPLAIALLVPTLERLGPADLLKRPARLLAQQPHLQHTLEHGWATLTPEDQAGLAAVAVAPASIPLDAAELLWPADPTAVPRLMRSGWLAVQPGVRARVRLLSPLQIFVRQVWPEPPEDVLLPWAIELVEAALTTLDGPRGHETARSLREDLPLLLGLVDTRGPQRTARLLEGLSEVLLRLGLDRRLPAWLAAAATPVLAVYQGKVELCTGVDARATVERALVDVTGDPIWEGTAWIELAIAHRFARDPQASLQALERAEALAQAHAIAPLGLRVSVERGMTLRAAGDLDGAWAAGEEAIARARPLENVRVEATARGLLGTLARQTARYAEAERMHLAAITLSEQVGDQNNAATARCNLANLLLYQDRWDEAEAHLRAGLATYLNQGYRYSEGFVYLALAHVGLGRQDRAAAAEHATEARLAFLASHNRTGRAHATLVLARLAHAAGDVARALALYDEAATDAPDWITPRALATLLRGGSFDDLVAESPDDRVLTEVRSIAARPAALEAWTQALASRDPDRGFLR